MSREFAVYKKFKMTGTLHMVLFCENERYHFLKMNSAADDIAANLFSSTAGLGNEMKLRLPPFSFNSVWCRHTFCFQFYNLPPF